MRVELVRIGNSRGIRIPKPLIKQCGLENTVELHVERSRIIIAPAQSRREGWDKAFRAAANSEDELLLGGLPEHQDNRKEGKW